MTGDHERQDQGRERKTKAKIVNRAAVHPATDGHSNEDDREDDKERTDERFHIDNYNG